MSYKGKALGISIVAAAILLLVASIPGWSTPVIRDGDPGTIGACLAQPDGTTVTLTAEQILQRGKSGKSFAIKEWFDQRTEQPRLVVVSTRPLPVEEFWTADVTGTLDTFSGTSRDGISIIQRVLIVSPSSINVYCDPKGRPFMFLPIKGLGMEWANKRSLAELSGTSTTQAASVSTMDEGTLPPMPDSLDSVSAPVYCATIADAEAQYSSTSRNLVELQCRPFSGATSTQFTLGQDDPVDSITVYYTGSSTLSGRINKIVGTIQKDVSNNYWIEVDSGTNWTEGDFVGSVQAVPEGKIAWVKTLPDGGNIPSYQQDPYSTPLVEKVVSRAFPNQGYFYIQESDRTNGIRVADSGMASVLNPGDIVTIYDGDITTVDGERVINSYYTEFVSSGTPPPLWVWSTKHWAAEATVSLPPALSADSDSTMSVFSFALGGR